MLFGFRDLNEYVIVYSGNNIFQLLSFSTFKKSNSGKSSSSSITTVARCQLCSASLSPRPGIEVLQVLKQVLNFSSSMANGRMCLNSMSVFEQPSGGPILSGKGSGVKVLWLKAVQE